MVRTACNGSHLKAQQAVDVPRSVATHEALPIPERRDSGQSFVSNAEQEYSPAMLLSDDLVPDESDFTSDSVQSEGLDMPSAGVPLSDTLFTEASESAPVADFELLHIDAEFPKIGELADTSRDSFVTSDLSESLPKESPAQRHSHEEWPVLMVPAPQNSFSKARASMVILTLLASAAAVYFLIYVPLSSGKREKMPASRSATEVSTAVVPEGSGTANPAGAEPTRISESKIETAPSAKQEPSIADALGQFSLQAAAFPVETGAAEFAEKLKRAGLPSYVVSADVAKRGRWYRVRVGRFETAEEAKRYSAEAQLRSKASGVSLQLIVCQYEQP